MNIKHENYHKSPDGDPIKEFAAPLIFQDGLNVKCIGTATIIRPGIALTSKHVIEQHLKDVGITDTNLSHDVRFNLFTYQILSPTDFSSWSVVNCFLAPNTDIAILKLLPGNKNACNPMARRLTLDLNPPKVGSVISGFGYPYTTVDSNVSPVIIDLDSHTTTGVVHRIYKNKRDSSMMPFPCIELSARFEGGMSGGPLFNDEGSLIGLITSGVDSDSNEYTSYAALLWPIMSTNIEFDRSDYPDLNGTMYPFLELARDDHIMALGSDRVTIYHENNQRYTKFDYKI